MSTYAIKADKFFLPAGPQLGGYLMVEDGVFGAWQADEPACEIKDYSGTWIAPGMVDTHIHGFYNHATTDNDAEGINISSTELARRGTTSWLPTTFTDGVEQIKDACAAIAQADEERGPEFCGARIQGIYLEGPFFTMKHVGAQNPAYLIDPSEKVFDEWQEAAGGRIVKSAMAAERDGAAAYAAALSAKGVVTCIGHSDATYDECAAAINAGASCFTHTYNGQRGLHHREPGVVGAAMTTSNTYAEIICDGKHVHPAAIKALLQAKG
ncbi:MAG: N-acetylglucosamine-6-phosphate deacetylase, partial [Collinsella sp.]